ncbi:response regulator transcription factor [Dehalogenimonas sp. THU2]|uniref:response regulator transcription factor n=1 Tax=Dehalogenimonas sp. THU2 TaxID=3151121 RepID=UPI003218CE48
MRILVIEDEKKLCQIMKRGLVEEGYAVDTAFDGEDGRFMAEFTPYDLIILDVMLPKENGIEVVQKLRLKGVKTPVLMLTAKDTVEDRVKGLDAGADDYLVKPFAFSELMARIRALLRRDSSSKSSRLVVGDLILDTQTREVSRGNREIELTNKEYAILEYLMRHSNMVITRTMLEENAWDYQSETMSNLIDVYIKKLRHKIDADSEVSLIQTVRGAGYRLRAA